MEALNVNDTLFKGEHSTDEILKYYNEWAQTGKYDEVRHIVWEGGRGCRPKQNFTMLLFSEFKEKGQILISWSSIYIKIRIGDTKCV